MRCFYPRHYTLPLSSFGRVLIRQHGTPRPARRSKAFNSRTPVRATPQPSPPPQFRGLSSFVPLLSPGVRPRREPLLLTGYVGQGYVTYCELSSSTPKPKSALRAVSCSGIAVRLVSFSFVTSMSTVGCRCANRLLHLVLLC